MRSGVPGNSLTGSVLDARWTHQTLEGRGCIQDGPAHEPRLVATPGGSAAQGNRERVSEPRGVAPGHHPGYGRIMAIDTHALGELDVQDVNGASVRVGSAWAAGPAVLVFLRHFG
jgi:hypothetical protein